jgi:DNA-binding MltR family transcriptional regulator
MKDNAASFTAFFTEFKNESERAIVVLTAARLDYLLFQLLHKYVIPNVSKTDDFFENQGPGSSFSNKIMLCYRLGLIDRQFTQALNLIRRIRNDFAHEATACTLSKGSHADRVEALTAPYRNLEIFKYFQKMCFEGVDRHRSHYMIMVGILMMRLEYIIENITPRDEKEAALLFQDHAKNLKNSDLEGEIK